MMTHAYLGPDWVMLGAALQQGGVMIIGSTELSQAELTIQRDSWIDDFTQAWGFETIPVTRYEITAEMRSFVIAYGNDYTEALANLMKTWTPTTRNHPAINEGMRELNKRT